MHKESVVLQIGIIQLALVGFNLAVTVKQFEASLDMMRSGCAPKFKLTTEELDNIRMGNFVEDNKDLKCYTKCIAQLAGILTKKGDFSFQKAIGQIPIILPVELQDNAKKAFEACIEVQKRYKDSCEKVFYTVKCVHDFDPKSFKFP